MATVTFCRNGWQYSAHESAGKVWVKKFNFGAPSHEGSYKPEVFLKRFEKTYRSDEKTARQVLSEINVH